MYCLKGNVTFVSQPGETISVYGIDGKSKFSSVGLKYPLNDVSLKFGEKESTSNESISKVVNLKVKQGKGLIVRELNVIKKNDFLFNN
jgi:thiamine pyrophosphokinase